LNKFITLILNMMSTNWFNFHVISQYVRRSNIFLAYFHYFEKKNRFTLCVSVCLYPSIFECLNQSLKKPGILVYTMAAEHISTE
jgi:hypothetical protein